MTAYYNEIDPFAAEWLRELIRRGHIAPGDVDERSIADVRAADLVGYRQVHLFAGIGGWSLALRLAGIPDDAEVWTGSCPCQPFSTAGRGRGTDDERHLWPEMRRLVAERLPPAVLGEQVASHAGRDWLAVVRSDLEALGYAVGAADLCAAGVGAPHIRQRLFWVGLADADIKPCGEGRQDAGGRDSRGNAQAWAGPGGGGSVERLGDAGNARPEGHGRPVNLHDAEGRASADGHRPEAGFWDDCDWIPCSDNTYRPVEPGTSPLVARLPKGMGGGRKGSLRGYGNAIVPQVAAVFARAVMG